MTDMEHDTKPYKIQIVDPEVAHRIELGRELSSAGYEVSDAATCKTAMKQYKSGKVPDMTISELRFNEKMDGFELMKYVKGNHPTTKFLVLTHFADLKNALVSKKFGAEDFVSKPYDIGELIRYIERIRRD